MINRELIRLKTVQLIYAYYQNEGKTLDVAKKELDFSLEKAYDLYLNMLYFLVEIKQLAEKYAEISKAHDERMGIFQNRKTPALILSQNLLLNQLSENTTLCEYVEKHGSVWKDEESLVKKIYQAFLDSETFQLYCTDKEKSYAADRELIRKLYKDIIMDNPDFDSVLEEQSLYWNDDKDVVDSFILKTIKRFHPEEEADMPLLPAYSSDTDYEFAHELFESTILRGEEVRELIRNNCKNWEFGRLSIMDVVITQIALTEILTFPNIPLKVSFNEYLDIAKAYSTPKSSSYINGLLDHIVKLLQSEGTIMKN